MLFSKQEATLIAIENQTNYKQLQNTKTIDSNKNQNKNTPGCFCNKEKESQKDKQEEDSFKKVNKKMVIARSLNSSCNPQKTITAFHQKNEKPKREKNEKSTFVIGENIVNNLNGWEITKKLNSNCNVFFKTSSGAKTT